MTVFTLKLKLHYYCHTTLQYNENYYNNPFSRTLHSIPRLVPVTFSFPEKIKNKRVSSNSSVKDIMTKIMKNKLFLVFNNNKADTAVELLIEYITSLKSTTVVE